MRLRALTTLNIQPIKNFAVDELADVVVLAGPNGVGKTRLVQALIQAFQAPVPRPIRPPRTPPGAPPIPPLPASDSPLMKLTLEATCPSETAQWGKNLLDTAVPADAALLLKTLQSSKRRRGNWRSSVLNFESDRTIQAIQPYAFTWDIEDPWEEDIGWTFGFGGLRARFQDTLHSIFRKLQSRRDQIATHAERLLAQGVATMPLNYPNPMEPFQQAFSQLLAPKELLHPDSRKQQLKYRLDGKEFNIDSLSSGEREVVNIVFDFLLRNPNDCIVMFDEPELHLHPELSYKLLQTLRTVGRNNQFIFCTHSADIITASLDQSVIFIAPPGTAEQNQAIVVREDDETHEALKLLGQSVGIISLGRRIVLIEGLHTSLDKQVYGTILGSRFPNLVLVPVGGRSRLKSFSDLAGTVLQKTIWGVEFFMLCDRDAAPASTSIPASTDRLQILPRYHLENYFLDENIIAGMFEPMESEASWLRSPEQIRAGLKEIALGLLSYTAALIISSSYREAVGNLDIMPSDCHGKSAAELARLLLHAKNNEVARITSALDETEMQRSIERTFEQLTKSLEDADTWKSVIPGKPLLHSFASKTQLSAGRFKLMYLKHAQSIQPSPFAEVIAIFQKFSA